MDLIATTVASTNILDGLLAGFAVLVLIAGLWMLLRGVSGMGR